MGRQSALPIEFFVISGKEIRGFYDTFEAALRFAVVTFGKGEYIIQQILPKDDYDLDTLLDRIDRFAPAMQRWANSFNKPQTQN